jgi:hypothetical protein
MPMKKAAAGPTNKKNPTLSVIDAETCPFQMITIETCPQVAAPLPLLVLDGLKGLDANQNILPFPGWIAH